MIGIRKIIKNKFIENKVPDINLNCSFFEINNHVISRFIVKKLIPIVDIHPFPLNELILMTAAVVRLKPDVVFEWGTNIGKSARIFLEIKNYFKMNYEIHSIDLPDDVFHSEHPHHKRGHLVRNKKVNLHLGDGIAVSLKLLKDYGFKKPLFFIDGDHSYESVKRELSTIMKEIPEANILLHDTFFQSSESGYNVGPFLAVRDCLVEIDNSLLELSTNTGLPGMTLLYKI